MKCVFNKQRNQLLQITYSQSALFALLRMVSVLGDSSSFTSSSFSSFSYFSSFFSPFFFSSSFWRFSSLSCLIKRIERMM